MLHRVLIRPSDGHVVILTNVGNPTLDDAYAEHIAATPEQTDWEWHDVESETLPPRDADCDECGEQHSVRDLWRSDGKVVQHDQTLRNHRAEGRHLELAEAAELQQDEPDVTHLALIQATYRRLVAHAQGRGDLPPKRHVDAIIARHRKEQSS